jgi:hypothetical protein
LHRNWCYLSHRFLLFIYAAWLYVLFL